MLKPQGDRACVRSETRRDVCVRRERSNTACLLVLLGMRRFDTGAKGTNKKPVSLAGEGVFPPGFPT